jgi:CrcB protein
MQQLLVIFIGGGIGSIFRFLLGNILNKDTFAYGTMAANILGSLLIGFIMGLHFRASVKPLTDTQLAFLVIGIFGGFTTFSSFMYENIMLLYQGAYTRFFLYTLLSIIIGLVAAFAGFMGGKALN